MRVVMICYDFVSWSGGCHQVQRSGAALVNVGGVLPGLLVDMFVVLHALVACLHACQ